MDRTVSDEVNLKALAKEIEANPAKTAKSLTEAVQEIERLRTLLPDSERVVVDVDDPQADDATHLHIGDEVDEVRWGRIRQELAKNQEYRERIAELETELAKRQNVIDATFAVEKSAHAHADEMRAERDSLEAREQALIVANGKAEEERISAEEALAESQGRVTDLREVLQLAKDEPRRSMEGENRFWFMLDEALTSTQPEAEAHNARIRRETLEQAAQEAETHVHVPDMWSSSHHRVAGYKQAVKDITGVLRALAMEGE